MNVTNPLIITLLFIGAIIAFIPLCVIGFLYTTIKHIIRWDYKFSKQFFPIFHNLALILDGMANAFAGELLTDTLLKRQIFITTKDGRQVFNPSDPPVHQEAYKYGKWYDTISEVTGINEERGALNKAGMIFTKMLGIVLNDNHSVLAINRNRTYPPHTKK